MALDYILFAIASRGYADTLCTALLEDAFLRALRPSTSLRSATLAFFELYSKCAAVRLTPALYQNLVSSLSQNDKAAVTDALRKVEAAVLLLAPFELTFTSAHYEDILISLIGHWMSNVRSSAIKYLNILYDGCDWQISQPHEPVIRVIGQAASVSVTRAAGVALSLDLVSPLSSSAVRHDLNRMSISPVAAADGDGTVCFDLPLFWRSGFYDWRVVVVGDDFQSTPFSHPNGSPYQGRFIVHPDVRSDCIHESWPDLEDAKWHRTTGELVQRGSFATVRANLDKYKQHGVSCLYLLGVVERDPLDVSNHGMGSPFAATDRARICTSIGGADAFRELVGSAHDAGMSVVVDSTCRVSASHYHRKYAPLLCQFVDSDGRLQAHYGTDGKSVHWPDTFLLNYRDKRAWDILISDIADIASSFQIDGVRLDNAHAWPILLPHDLAELGREDPDGKPHYDAVEILRGHVVSLEEDTYSVYSDSPYPNPMLIKVCRSLWALFPKFIIFSECAQHLERNLVVAGTIPYSSTLPSAINAAFGRTVLSDGSVLDTRREGVSSLLRWYDEERTRLPQDSIVVHSSCNHDTHFPAFLYGRGAWANVDLLFFLPELPQTFIGEFEGLSSKVETLLAKVSRQRKRPSAVAARNDVHVKAASDGFHMDLVSRIATSEPEQQYRKRLGPEYGFDLRLISGHYIHRAKLRKAYPLLTSGAMVLATSPLF